MLSIDLDIDSIKIVTDTINKFKAEAEELKTKLEAEGVDVGRAGTEKEQAARAWKRVRLGHAGTDARGRTQTG